MFPETAVTGAAHLKRWASKRINMKLLSAILVTTMLCLNTEAFSASPVSPEEMVNMCGSLQTYVSLAVQSKNSGMPLDSATNMTEASMRKHLAPDLTADSFNRYLAVVRELYKRIYALPSIAPQTVNRVIAPACMIYAEGQYSESDIKQMQICVAKSQPYLGFANMRDQGMSLEAQLKWLKEEGLKNAAQSPEESEKLYSELSVIMKYVYAHPELNKQSIYSQKFNACYKEAKR